MTAKSTPGYQPSLDGVEDAEASDEELDIEELVRREVEKRMGQSMNFDLPPNAFRGNNGRYFHVLEVTTEGGAKVKQTRPLGTTLEEAIANRWDFYHPTVGLIYEGYKLARDRDANDIMSDTSQSQMRPESAAELARLQTAGSGA